MVVGRWGHRRARQVGGKGNRGQEKGATEQLAPPIKKEGPTTIQGQRKAEDRGQGNGWGRCV